MGRIFTLSGPSGVGKTSFLLALFSSKHSDLVLLPRYTDRPKRSKETEGFEHFFTSHSGLLQKVLANDFIHIEKWGDYYSAIESRTIIEAIAADYDGIVLTSVFAADRVRATFGLNVSCLYLWTGTSPSLSNPRCLEEGSAELIELEWRIRKKLAEHTFSEYETASLSDDAFVKKRMVDNYLDMAAVNGRLRKGEDFFVISNLRDKLDDAISEFLSFRGSLKPLFKRVRKYENGCFVLMPFREELRPVYEDHISKVCTDLHLSVTRADQIFSTKPIMDDIRESVIDAQYIIADLTDNNPNVFYELGICHALGKKVILITQGDVVPSDVSHIQYFRYDLTPKGMQALEITLRATLQSFEYNT
jgi:guanylate kinase